VYTAGTSTIALAGNRWDHAPPLLGSDIFRLYDEPRLDISSPSIAPDACP